MAERKLEKSETPDEKYKRSLNDAINSLPDRESAEMLMEKLDLIVSCRSMGLKEHKGVKETFTHVGEILTHRPAQAGGKPPKIDSNLLRAALGVKGIVEAHDAIESYELLIQAIKGEREAEKALSDLLTIRRSRQSEKVGDLLVQEMKGNERVIGAMLKDKEDGEAYLKLLELKPELVEQVRNDVRKALKV